MLNKIKQYYLLYLVELLRSILSFNRTEIYVGIISLVITPIFTYMYKGYDFIVEETTSFIIQSIIPLIVLLIIHVSYYIVSIPVEMFDELGGFGSVNVSFDISRIDGIPGQKHVVLLIHNGSDRIIRDCVVTVVGVQNINNGFIPIPEFIAKNDRDRILMWTHSNDEKIDILGKEEAYASIAVYNGKPIDSFWFATKPVGIGNNKSYKYKATTGSYSIQLEISGIFLWRRFRVEKRVGVEFNDVLDIRGFFI